MNVEFNSTSESEIVLSVFDLAGKVILQQQDKAALGVNVYQLSVNHLTSGVYFVEVRNGNEVSRTKFMKE